jgi:putative lipoprotein (rSAM/lipoprotein system)
MEESMAKKIARFPGQTSRWALRLIGAMTTFIFTFFVYTSGQVIQNAGFGKASDAKAATGRPALAGDTMIVAPDYGVIPLYGIIPLYGVPLAEFTIKGKIRSEAGEAPIRNIRVAVKDTSTAGVFDSAVTQEDGSFSLSFTVPPAIHTWILEVRDVDGVQNGAFSSKDTLVSIPLDSLKGSSSSVYFYAGAASADIELFLQNATAVIAPGGHGAAAKDKPRVEVFLAANGAIEMRYTLAVQGRAALSLFSADGRLVRGISDRWESCGGHVVAVARAGLAPGTYFLKLQTATHAAITKVQIAR